MAGSLGEISASLVLKTNQLRAGAREASKIFRSIGREAGAALKKTSSFVEGLASFKNAIAGSVVVGASLATFHIAKMGASFRDARAAFQASGADLQGFREATSGLIGDVQLVQQFNLARSLGVNEEAFKSLSAAALAAARTTGQSANFLFQSAITGAARGSAQILDNLGIKVKKTGDRAKFMNNVIAEANRIVAEAGDIANSASVKYTRLETSFKNTQLEAALLADTIITNLGVAFESLFDGSEAGKTSLREVLDLVRSAIAAVADLERALISGLVNALTFAFRLLLQVWEGVLDAISGALSSLKGTELGDLLGVDKLVGGLDGARASIEGFRQDVEGLGDAAADFGLANLTLGAFDVLTKERPTAVSPTGPRIVKPTEEQTNALASLTKALQDSDFKAEAAGLRGATAEVTGAVQEFTTSSQQAQEKLAEALGQALAPGEVASPELMALQADARAAVGGILGNLEEAARQQIRDALKGSESLGDFSTAMRTASEAGFDFSGDARLMQVRAALVAQAFGENERAMEEQTKTTLKTSDELKDLMKASKELADAFGELSAGEQIGRSLAGPGLFENIVPRDAAKSLGKAVDGALAADPGAISSALGSGIGKILGSAGGTLGAAIGGAIGGPIASGIGSAIGTVVADGLEGIFTAAQSLFGRFFKDQRFSQAGQFAGALGATVPLLILVGAVLTALSAGFFMLLTPVIALGLAFGALAGFAFIFAQETKNFQRVQQAFTMAINAFIAPFESIAFELLALAPIVEIVGAVFGEMLAVFGADLPNILFTALKLLGLALLGTVIILENLRIPMSEAVAGIAIHLNSLQIALIDAVSAIDGLLSTVGLGFGGQDLRDEARAAAQSEIDNLTGIIGESSDALDAALGAFDELYGLEFGASIGRALEGLDELGDGTMEAGTALSDLGSELNVPQGVKVQLQRFRSTTAAPGALDALPGLPEEIRDTPSVRIDVERIEVNDVQDARTLVDRIADLALSETGNYVGASPINNGSQS